jgi:Icc-related predicted phosphoesterase
MRVHLMSDLHLEFGKMPRSYTPPQCDVVVLAGDIATGVAGVMWAAETFEVPVIYVPGNHEYYGKRVYTKHLEKMKAKAAGTNVCVLNNGEAQIGGVTFLGATLWTDFDLYGTPWLNLRQAQDEMNDYVAIHTAQQTPLTAEDTRSFHLESRYFLSERLRALQANGQKAVVVSHHAPSELSTLPRYKGHPLTPAYASRLEPMIGELAPALWVHGHMHASADYTIYDTRIVCNPRGYHGYELNADFDPALVLEI